VERFLAEIFSMKQYVSAFLKVVLSCFCVLHTMQEVDAQNPIMLASGRYSGSYGAQLNPSTLAFNRPFWSVQLMGAGAGFQNNLLSMKKLSFPAVLLGTNQFVLVDNDKARARPFGTDDADALIQEHIDQPMRLRQSAFAMPLAATFQLGKHGFGFFTQIRQQLHVDQLAARSVKQMWEGFLYEPLLDSLVSSQQLQFQFDAWSEIGATYSYRLYQSWTKSMSVGITAKALIGLQTLQMDLDQLDYTVSLPDSVRINNIQGRYARSLGPDDNGLGFAVDVGYTFVKIDTYSSRRPKKRRSTGSFNFRRRGSVRKEAPDYLWKLGVSVLDLGMIRYNSTQYALNAKATYNTVTRFFDLSQQNYDAGFMDPLLANGAVIAAKGFSVGMPTALSVQFDGKIYEQFYFYAGWVQRLPIFGDYSMRRTNYLTAAGRFELAKIEVNIPMTLIEYEWLNIGLSARFGPVMIGTDGLGRLFGLHRSSGADIYFGLNLFEFWNL